MITPALDNVLDLNPSLKIVNDVFALKRILQGGTIKDMGVVIACMENSTSRKWARIKFGLPEYFTPVLEELLHNHWNESEEYANSILSIK
ncbi:MAG: hypothetical protein PHY48_17790 [Candidatus Cloacimonetes bacterium]|nr:hypothetical protein [Candidatus Cloacimonadota bacterium]